MNAQNDKPGFRKALFDPPSNICFTVADGAVADLVDPDEEDGKVGRMTRQDQPDMRLDPADLFAARVHRMHEADAVAPAHCAPLKARPGAPLTAVRARRFGAWRFRPFARMASPPSQDAKRRRRSGRRPMPIDRRHDRAGWEDARTVKSGIAGVQRK